MYLGLQQVIIDIILQYYGFWDFIVIDKKIFFNSKF